MERFFAPIIHYQHKQKNSMKNFRAIIIVLIIIIVGFVVWSQRRSPDSISSGASIQPGCYVAELGRDVYTLRITSVDGAAVSGELAYDNFEKDSSSGTFRGTYENGTLLGEYAFTSEGTDSIRQVIFRKEGNNFVQGFGPVEVVGNRESFANLAEITYDSGLTFAPTATCTQTESQAVRNVVLEFGKKLQLVSVLAPREDLVEAIETHYSPYVSPVLLEQWKAQTSGIPGRETSSPWPDRIEIDSLIPKTVDAYEIQGRIVEVASAAGGTAPVREIPVVIELEQSGGNWLITRFEKR